jgi:energy-coupling factor transporter transmembrane protein EcfT
MPCFVFAFFRLSFCGTFLAFWFLPSVPPFLLLLLLLLILVLSLTGHYDCGAVRAASARQDLGTLENWLRMIRDVYRLHKEYLDLIYNEEKRHFSLVELNVIEQCLNIYKAGKRL